MAIEKTIFTGTTLAAQAPEVLAWLQANATEYFDSIEYDDETSTIVCSVDNKPAMELFFDPATYIYNVKLYLANGLYVQGQARPSTTAVGNGLFLFGIKTSNGLVIRYNYTTGLEGVWPDGMFITKTEDDELALAAMFRHSTNVSACYFETGIFNKSNAWSAYLSGANQTTFASIYFNSAELTTLTPIPDKSWGSYTPNLFIMRFSQFVGVEGKLTINGEEYWSNGYLALKG